jgi:hypothetical protein
VVPNVPGTVRGTTCFDRKEIDVDQNERAGLTRLLAEVDQEQASRPRKPDRVAAFDQVWDALAEALEAQLADDDEAEAN